MQHRRRGHAWRGVPIFPQGIAGRAAGSQHIGCPCRQASSAPSVSPQRGLRAKTSFDQWRHSRRRACHGVQSADRNSYTMRAARRSRGRHSLPAPGLGAATARASSLTHSVAATGFGNGAPLPHWLSMRSIQCSQSIGGRELPRSRCVQIATRGSSRRRWIVELLRVVELDEGFMDRLPGELSG
jgi:hypothetical protein